jgi:hypothetical protein
MDLARSSLEERCGAGRRRGSRGEDVVDEEEARRRGATRDASERIGHRLHPFFAGQARLRRGGPRPADEGRRWELQLPCERPREHASLVESALGPPPGSERHPRHGVGRRRAERCQGAGERLPHPSPAGELQAVDGLAGRAAVRERRSRRRDRRRRAVAALVEVPEGGPAAAPAPRRSQRFESAHAGPAERPRACAAPGAGPWEEDIDRPVEHGVTLRRAPDTQGSLTSIGSPAPFTAIVSAPWVFRRGYAVTDPAPVATSKLASRTGTRAPSAASVIDASAPS